MKNKKVLLFLSQGFEAYEAGVFTDVIGWSRELGIEPVDMISTALRPEIKCKWNLIVRPEIEFDKVDKLRGLEVVIVTTANTDEEGRDLLELLGMPFVKE